MALASAARALPEQVSWRAAADGPAADGQGNWNGGRWHGGRWHGGRWWPYAAVVAGLGLAAWPYYGGPGYYDDYYPYVDETYVDPGYVDGGYVEPGYGDNGVAYCIRRFRTYDQSTGTYIGKGGRRYPCP